MHEVMISSYKYIFRLGTYKGHNYEGYTRYVMSAKSLAVKEIDYIDEWGIISRESIVYINYTS